MANFRNYFRGHLQAVLPGEDATLGAITSSHIGNVVVASTPGVVLATGTSDDTARYVGIIAAVPNAVTAGGSVPFYVMPFTYEEEVEVEYDRDNYTDSDPTDADIGKFIAFGSTATVAGAKLDTGTIDTGVGGDSTGRWLKITGYDTNRRVVYGRPDDTRISK